MNYSMKEIEKASVIFYSHSSWLVFLGRDDFRVVEEIFQKVLPSGKNEGIIKSDNV